jgi:hypothetical protein
VTRLIRPHEFAFADASQVVEGLAVWANARHKWRRAKVVEVRGDRAVVAFRLQTAPRVVVQALPISSLMRWAWEPPARLRLHTTAPTLDEARAVLAAMRRAA